MIPQGRSGARLVATRDYCVGSGLAPPSDPPGDKGKPAALLSGAAAWADSHCDCAMNRTQECLHAEQIKGNFAYPENPI